MNSAENMISASLDLLTGQHGVQEGSDVVARIDRYLELIREWNEVLPLVSSRDSLRLDEHAADSLSLVPFIYGRAGGMSGILDIGSGNGFPIIPIKIVLPEVAVCLMERSLRKVGFLRKVVAALGLTDVTIVRGSFPQDSPLKRPLSSQRGP